MVTITPEEYAYIRNYLYECTGQELEERKAHIKKELVALYKLAQQTAMVFEIGKLHSSILIDGDKDWNDWADNYIRELREAYDKSIQSRSME